MLIAILLLIGSLIVLTLGAEVLVRGATAIALKLGVSPLFIGLTIVAFGTSSPELGASLAATLRGSPDIAVGNVVGSNIFNIAIILGLAAAVKPIAVRFAAIRRDIAIVILMAVPLWCAPLLGGVIPRWLGAFMFLLLVAYIWRSYLDGRQAPAAEQKPLEGEIEQTLHISPPDAPRKRWWEKTPALIGAIIIGLALLVAGSQVFVHAAVDLARDLGLSELVIGLTIVAAGTSMPELMTSTVAAIRGRSDIAVGNVLGSNIFNILGILGISAMVVPQAVSLQVVRLDAVVMFLASVALLPIMRTGGRISRAEGVLLLAGYAVYLLVLLVLAPRWFG